MAAHDDPPDACVAAVRSVCLTLPEVVEEAAWTGTRWRVGTRTFAHVLHIANGWPPAYARAAATDGPTTVLMFRAGGEELEVLRGLGAPWFAPPWRSDEVGLCIGPRGDWREVGELLLESYRCRAPKRLVARLDASDPHRRAAPS